MTVQELEQKIRDLESRLSCNSSSEGDWKISKCIEYQLLNKELPYDIRELGTARQAIRDEINEIHGYILELQEAATEKMGVE